jgi:serine/threonine protein kinase/Flp pilus assembly protein TadD
MDTLIGKTLSHYRIVEKIGAGGMGEVYRAEDPRLGRDVAIKVLPREHATDSDRLRRFEQETRAAGALNHPNVCAIYDVGTDAGSPFVVMELLDGESLRARLAAGSVEVRRAIDYATQAALGLAAAHGKGIVHRDLKPENLFVTRDGRVKILDFGLAKRTGGIIPGPQGEQPTQDAVPATQAGWLLGTVGYMSPEQARGESADARSDIWSLGCVLYEMLAGREPFRKGTPVETLSALLTEDPAPLSSPSGTVPGAAERIVARCLKKRPEDRFASAADLHFALQSLLPAPRLDLEAGAPAEKSIVVLPFENLSPDPENAYFADGLTEEIISDLAKVRALRVISRTSAMLLRGSKKDVPTIARDLRVRYALEGSVRRAGNSLRITAQLIDAATDAHLWADKYTGSLEDVFEMEEKVSRAIVEALRLELTPREHERLAERPIPNVYAFECYLKARAEILHFSPTSLDRAMKYLEQGLQGLPDNAMLLAGMAYLHYIRANIGVGGRESMEKAMNLATRALEIAPELPQGHLALALGSLLAHGLNDATPHLERVLAVDPHDVDALSWLGQLRSHQGRIAEATALGERAVAIDPMSWLGHTTLAISSWLDGRFTEAIGFMDRAVEVDPPQALMSEDFKVLILICAGRREEGIALAGRLETEAPRSVFDRMAQFWRYAAAGGRDRALQWMPPEDLEACRWSAQKSWWVACGHAMLGDADTALDWLENAIERGFLNHRYFGEIDPSLAPLRGDPRFQALLARARERQAGLEDPTAPGSLGR